MKYLATLVLITILSLAGYAQTFPVLKYSTSHGLGHQVVYHIHQDKKGLLWFSTDNGLTRYDGTHFKNYTAKDGLGSNFIFGVVDHDTTLLVSTFGAGVHTFNGTRFTPLPASRQIPYPLKLTLHDTSLWVIDRNFDLYRINKHSFRKFNKPKHIFYHKAKVINNTLWVGSTKLFEFNPRYDSLIEQPIKGIPWPSTSFLNILPISDSTWIITTTNKVYQYNRLTKAITPLLQGDFSFNSENLLLAHDRHVWVTETKGRVWRLSPDLKTKQLIFDNVVVNDIHQDIDNNIWLATYGQGLWCLPSTHIQVYPLPGLLYPTVFFSKQLNRPLITSTNEGVYSLEKNTLKRISLLQNNLDKERIVCFYEADKSETVVGTLSWVVSKKGNTFREQYLLKAQSSVYKDRKNNYWAGMRMGLAQLDSTLQHPVFDSLFTQRIVRSIMEDDKHLLVGTDAGLYRKTSDGWQYLNRKQGLTNEYVNTILYDRARDTRWIGTNEGLFSMDASGKIVNRFPDLRCNVLVADKQNHVWAATSKGLLHFDGQTFEIYNEKEGLSSDLTSVAYQADKHILYVLSSENLFTLEVDGFLQELSSQIPVVLIDEHRADSLILNVNQHAQRLSEEVQTLAVQFVLPMYKKGANWRVYYKLNDLEWTDAGDDKQLDFYQLPYGDNMISIKAEDKINQRSSEVLVLRYTIETPFFRKKPVVAAALVLITLASVALSVFLVRYTNRKKQRRFFEAQRKAELEQKVLRNMLNPHFMNNALNAIQTFVTRNDQRKTLSYLAKFARLMRINLELLEQSTISLEKELQNLELYLEFEVLRSDGKLAYEIRCDAALNQAKLKVPSLVLQPFVENAIWHGILPGQQQGTVSISVYRIEKTIHIEIVDNGIGLEEAGKRKSSMPATKPSRGLMLIQDRFALLNQQEPGHNFSLMDNQLRDGHGTTVHITLPVRW